MVEGKSRPEPGILWYILTLLSAINALKLYNLPPSSGGFLNQPAVLWKDIEAVERYLTEKRREQAEVSAAVQSALSSSQFPDVPPPNPPKEIHDGQIPRGNTE